jgi:hypothetical protein
MNNKVLCCLICIIVIIILVSIIVTNKKENFQAHNPADDYLQNFTYEIPQSINSIISKVDGTMLNVKTDTDTDQSSTSNNKTIEILIDNNDARLCMDGAINNNLIKCSSSNKQTWALTYIGDVATMNQVSSNQHLGQRSTMINYPFFMVLKGDLALQYNNGRFSVALIGNYDSQKWDVSSQKINSGQLFIRDIYDGPLDKMPYSRGSDPKDRVKINLNVNDERLKEILHIDSGGAGGAGATASDSKCGKYVPNEAVENLCSGCKL